MEQDLGVRIDQERDIPLVWGNGRMLFGLVELYKRSGRPEALAMARRLGDYFVANEKYYSRKENFEPDGDTVLSFATSYFSIIEGLEILASETGDARYHECAKRIGQLLRRVPDLDGLHSHGHLAGLQVSSTRRLDSMSRYSAWQTTQKAPPTRTTQRCK